MEDDDEYEITYDEVNVDRLLQRASAAVGQQVLTMSDQPGVLAGLPAQSETGQTFMGHCIPAQSLCRRLSGDQGLPARAGRP